MRIRYSHMRRFRCFISKARFLASISFGYFWVKYSLSNYSREILVNLLHLVNALTREWTSSLSTNPVLSIRLYRNVYLEKLAISRPHVGCLLVGLSIGPRVCFHIFAAGAWLFDCPKFGLNCGYTTVFFNHLERCRARIAPRVRNILSICTRGSDSTGSCIR